MLTLTLGFSQWTQNGVFECCRESKANFLVHSSLNFVTNIETFEKHERSYTVNKTLHDEVLSIFSSIHSLSHSSLE